MPNTLAHIGIQAVLGRRVTPKASLHWIFLACILPDLSWILQKAARAFPLGIDPIDLRTYAIAQSSLFFCLIIAAAFALLSRNIARTFTILAFGSLLHLLLDATQTKWGNGVILFAPIDWSIFSPALFWPEEAPSYILTAFGIVFVAFYWFRRGPEPIRLQQVTKQRLVASFAILIVWVTAPFYFMADVEAANLHDTQTLRMVDMRPGQAITIDRNRLSTDSNGELFLQIWTGEKIALLDAGNLPETGVISIKGTFVTPQSVRVHGVRVHQSDLRDWLSYFGLIVILLWWVQGAVIGLKTSS